MTKPLNDPFVDAAVECALAPLVGVLPPDLLEERRRSLRLGLAMHPRAQDILRRLHARPPGHRSGTVVTHGFAPADDDVGDTECGRGGVR